VAEPDALAEAEGVEAPPVSESTGREKLMGERNEDRAAADDGVGAARGRMKDELATGKGDFPGGTEADEADEEEKVCEEVPARGTSWFSPVSWDGCCCTSTCCCCCWCC